MSYHTRKVVRPAAPKVNGLLLALLRLMSQLDDTHASDVTISAPNETSGGCKFQLGYGLLLGLVSRSGILVVMSRFLSRLLMVRQQCLLPDREVLNRRLPHRFLTLSLGTVMFLSTTSLSVCI